MGEKEDRVTILPSIENLEQLQSALQTLDSETTKKLLEKHKGLVSSLTPAQFIGFISNCPNIRSNIFSLTDVYLREAKNIELEDLKKIKNAYESFLFPMRKKKYLSDLVSLLIDNNHITTIEEGKWLLSITSDSSKKEHILKIILKNPQLNEDELASIGYAYLSTTSTVSSFVTLLDNDLDSATLLEKLEATIPKPVFEELIHARTLQKLELAFESSDNPDTKHHLVTKHTGLISSLPPDKFSALLTNYSGNKVMMESLVSTYLKNKKNISLSELMDIEKVYISNAPPIEPLEREEYLNKFFNPVFDNQLIKTPEDVNRALFVTKDLAIKEHVLNKFLKTSKPLNADEFVSIARNYLENKDCIPSFIRLFGQTLENKDLIEKLKKSIKGDVFKELITTHSFQKLQAIVFEPFDPQQVKELLAEHNDLIASIPFDKFIAFFSSYSGNQVMMESLTDAYLKEHGYISLDEFKKFKEAYILGSKSSERGLTKFAEQLHDNNRIRHAEVLGWALSTTKDPIIKERMLSEFLKDTYLWGNDLISIGTAYLSSKEDVSNFVRLVPDVLQSDTTLEKLKDNLDPIIYEELSNQRTIKLDTEKVKLDTEKVKLDLNRAGLVLGLLGDEFEGSTIKDANRWTKERFSDLAPDYQPLAFNQTDSYKDSSAFSSPILQHGDWQGAHVGWERHSFSFHLIQDKNETHLIYVNRGQRDEKANDEDPAVTVYTFNNKEEMQKISSRLMDSLKTEKRSIISQFIHEELDNYKNDDLSRQLAKSDQKVGNCGIANANIAWHFALASRAMKEQGCSFSDAYKNTKAAYKVLRMEDRAKTFADVVTNADMIRLASDERNKFIVQTMLKMAAKEEETPGREAIGFLVDRLHKKDPAAVTGLFKDFISKHVGTVYETMSPWFAACADKINEEELDHFIKTNLGHKDLLSYIVNHSDTLAVVLNRLPERTQLEFLSAKTASDKTILEHAVSDPSLFKTILSNLPENTQLDFLNKTTLSGNSILNTVFSTPALFDVVWSSLSKDDRSSFFRMYSTCDQAVLHSNNSSLHILHQLSSDDKKEIMLHAINDEEYINKMDPKTLITLLSDLNDAERKGCLKTLNQFLSVEKKQHLVAAIHLDPSYDLRQSYSSHASTFSMTKIKLKVMESLGMVEEKIKSRAQKDVSGASMNSLIDAHKSQQQMMRDQLKGLRKNSEPIVAVPEDSQHETASVQHH